MLSLRGYCLPLSLLICLSLISRLPCAYADTPPNPSFPHYHQKNTIRPRISLNGEWKFCPAFAELQTNHEFLQKNSPEQKNYLKDEHDKNYGWIEQDFDDAVWWDITVPGSWNTQFEDLWSYEGHGWYRKTIAIPATWKKKRVVFCSEGANYRTVIYVNGNKVGVHEGGYTSFSFPIHSFLKFGEENTLAIDVDNESLLERCPMERHDWWDHGGLYRPVWLEATEKSYIDDLVVETDAMHTPARIRVRTLLASKIDEDTERTLDLRLAGPDKEETARIVQPVQLTKKSIEIDLEIEVENALLWTPAHPNLYTLTVDLRSKEGDRVLDRRQNRVGIRTIQIDGTRLLVNGEPFLIQGINRYENYPKTGMTSTERNLRRDLDLIKDLGVNAVRCHYPYSQWTYALCDEIGLFAVCEVPLYQWGRIGHSTKNLDAAKTQLDEMIRSLRNHPSVMMWSVSNETRTQPRNKGEEYRRLSEMVVEGNLELVEMANRLDTTRPVIEPSNEWPRDIVLEQTDLTSVNVYLGAPTPHVDSIPNMMDTMHERMQILRETYPDKPILVTEFGTWCLRGFDANYFPGERYQAALLSSYWEEFLKEPDFAGGFIWCFADSDVHRKYTRIYEMRCAYGIYDFHRKPKRAAAAIRKLWHSEE